jgi:hypothetical protein
VTVNSCVTFFYRLKEEAELQKKLKEEEKRLEEEEKRKEEEIRFFFGS